ncbi:MAG: YjfB family protein [Actinomycetota bacterium]
MDVTGVAHVNATLQATANNAQSGDAVGTAVLKEAMESAATVTAEVVEAAPRPAPSTPGLGGNVDVYA